MLAVEEEFPPLPNNNGSNAKNAVSTPDKSSSKNGYITARVKIDQLLPFTEIKHIINEISSKRNCKIEMCRESNSCTFLIEAAQPANLFDTKIALLKAVCTITEEESELREEILQFFRPGFLHNLQEKYKLDIRFNAGKKSIRFRGYKEGIELAKSEIEKFIIQESQKRTTLIEIEKSYLWFVTSPDPFKYFAETYPKLKITLKEHDEKYSIGISGETSLVSECQQKLSSAYEYHKLFTTEMSISIKKLNHRFLVGSKGAGLIEIWNKFHCYVQVSKKEDPKELVSIRGPEDLLIKAIPVIVEKAHSMAIKEIQLNDMQRKYMIVREKAALNEIEDAYDIHLHISSSSLEIQGRREKIEESWPLISALVAKVKSLVFSSLEFPKEFHKLVVGKKGQTVAKLKQIHQVDVIVPHSADDKVILFASSSAEKNEAAIKAVKEMADLVIVEFTVDPKFVGALIGPKGSKLKELQLKYPETSVKVLENSISLRGSEASANQLKDEMIAFVEEFKHYSILNGYTSDLEIPDNLMPFLSHVNIMKLKQEYQLRIDFKQGQKLIHLQGQQKNVESFKKELIARLQELADTVTVTLKIERKYHKKLIGSQGMYVKRLRDRYGVTINFPISSSDEENVTIRGPSKNVESAKNEIMDLLNYEISRSHVETIQVPHEYLGLVLGKGGSTIQAIRQDHDVDIEVDQKNIMDGLVSIKITGVESATKNARKDIERIIKSKTTSMRVIKIDPKYHGPLIGFKAKNLKKILDEFSVSIQFPKIGEESEDVCIKGNKEDVDKAINRIEEQLEELKCTVEEIIGNYPTHLKDSLFFVKNQFKVEVIPLPNSSSFKVLGSKSSLEGYLKAISPTTLEVDLKDYQLKELRSRFPLSSVQGTTVTTVAAQVTEIQDFIEKCKSFKSLVMPIEKSFHYAIIGRQSTTVNLIMEKTNTFVYVPSITDKSENIIIQGASQEMIDEAKFRILQIVEKLSS